jgi:hypothetical protein
VLGSQRLLQRVLHYLAHDIAANETRCGFSPHRPSPGGGALLVEGEGKEPPLGPTHAQGARGLEAPHGCA